MTTAMRLLLASTSPYRREALERLALPFDVVPSHVDETALPGEPAADLALRLATAKALAVSVDHPGAWVLGSDQVAACAGRTLGKPGGRTAAIAQLTAMSGLAVTFDTGVALARGGQVLRQAIDHTVVRMRALEAAEVSRYVDHDQPFDCAGSFKAERLGIALFESINSDDPTGLVGLPLILTARLLRAAGFRLP